MAYSANKVLIVEDDHFLSDIYLNALKKVGVKAQVAKNGREALAALGESEYQLILLDLIMPEMDGFDFLKALKKASLTKIPIIVLTNLGQDGDREECKSYGVLDYLVKTDIKPEDVIERVTKAIL